jgi:threonine dehydrogenase-like Zn-dependent dehydrogenase
MGIDLHIYSGAQEAAQCTPHTILGHEFSGTISAVGSDVKMLRMGDRVCIDPNDMCGGCYFCKIGKAHFCENMIGIGTTTDGGFAQYCTVNQKQVYKLCDELTFDEAAMAEPISCCLHGIDLTGVKAGDTVLVIGGGTIGQIMARLSGAAVLIFVEPVKEKRELALKLGADIAIDPFHENTAETLKKHAIKNINAVIECVGLKNIMEDAVAYVGKGGTAMFFGLTDPACQIPIAPFDIFKREITIKASFINPYTQQRAVDLLNSHKINVKELITDRVGLNDIAEVFSNQTYRSRGKIIIKPQL